MAIVIVNIYNGTNLQVPRVVNVEGNTYPVKIGTNI